MNESEALISRFYNALASLHADEMNACYSNDIVFYDPMFGLLKGEEAKAMWQMLCSRAQQFSLEYNGIADAGDGYYNCNWTARYTFSKTRRTVVNNGRAYMKIENGFITEHSDGWSLSKWSAQALGLAGKLFGWNNFFRRKIKNNAKRGLMEFMAENAERNN